MSGQASGPDWTPSLGTPIGGGSSPKKGKKKKKKKKKKKERKKEITLMAFISPNEEVVSEVP